MERICDLHGHFLPGMDDGCKTPEESVQLLQSSYQQGIGVVFATPHYYPVEPVEAFLARREESVRQLQEYIHEQGIADVPQICLGAEVAYRPGISCQEDLHKLCLGNSRYLLLEMPFSRWGNGEAREVRGLCVSQGVTPILAHIERYAQYQDGAVLTDILQQDVLVQMNAEYLLDRGTQRSGRKLLKKGVVQLLGTDCHNATDRAPNLGQAIAWLRKKRMEPILERIAQFSEEVCREAL